MQYFLYIYLIYKICMHVCQIYMSAFSNLIDFLNNTNIFKYIYVQEFWGLSDLFLFLKEELI